MKEDAGCFRYQRYLWFIIFVAPFTWSSECSPAGQCTCPSLYRGLPDVEGIAGRPLMFRLPTNAFAGHFTHLDIKVQTSNGSVLGSWLSYNHTTHSFSSVIVNKTLLPLSVQVTISCSVCDSSCPSMISDSFIIKTSATQKAGQYFVRQFLLELWQYLVGQHGMEMNYSISDNVSNRLLFSPIHNLSTFERAGRIYAFIMMRDMLKNLRYLCVKLQKQITLDNSRIRDKKHEFFRAHDHLCTHMLFNLHELSLTLCNGVALGQCRQNTQLNIITSKIMIILECKDSYRQHLKQHIIGKREVSEIINNSSLQLLNSSSSVMFSERSLDMFSDETQVHLKQSESFNIKNTDMTPTSQAVLFAQTFTSFSTNSFYDLANTISIDVMGISTTQHLISVYDEIKPSYLTSLTAHVKLESSTDFQDHNFYSFSKTEFTQYVDLTEYTAFYTPHATMTTHPLSTDSSFEAILSSPTTPNHLSMTSSVAESSESALTSVLSILIYPSVSVTDVIDTSVAPILSSAWMTELQPSSVQLPHADASSSILPDLTTSAQNFPPWLFQALAPITVTVGQRFEFTIPKNTFKDKEDGDTRKLSLSVMLPGDKPLPSELWLQFYAANQSMHGFPLANDYTEDGMKLVLVAEDSQGLTKRDAFSMTFNLDLIHKPSHNFIFQISKKFVKFIKNRDFYLSLFAEKVALYFRRYSGGALDAIKFGIINVSRSSVKGKGTMISVSVSECLYDDMESIYESMVNVSTGEMTKQFLENFNPEFTMIAVTYELTDICMNTLLAARTTPSSTSANTQSELHHWYKIFIPVVIFIIVCIIIILIIVLLRRRKSHDRSPMRKSDTFTFADQRNPIVLPGDIELHDVAYKPQRPAVLPSEKDHPPAGKLNVNVPESMNTRSPPPSYPGACMYNPGASASLDDSFESDSGPGVFVIGENGSHPPAYRVPPPYMPNPGFTYDEY